MVRLTSKLALCAGICLGALVGLPTRAESVADLRSAFVQTLEQQDVEASMALFTPDATFLNPDGARYDDRAAIRTLYRSVVAQYRLRLSMTSKHLVTSEKLCVDEGIYMETLTPIATGKPLALMGSYLFVAKLQPDGAWRIAEMVWTGGPH